MILYPPLSRTAFASAPLPAFLRRLSADFDRLSQNSGRFFSDPLLYGHGRKGIG
jgi:hypothetical protein